MQLSVITSLHNRLDLTRVYLESLERTLRGWRYEVILLDDASTDGTPEFLQTSSNERYRLVRNETRRGFAPNNNAGAQLARAPWLALLNNDLILQPGWFEPMARLLRWIPRVGCIGNVQREPTSGLIDHYGIHFDDAAQPLHAGHNEARAPRESWREWPAVTAACCLVKADFFREMGGFHEGFQNGLEDVDLCLRASALGYRHFVANRSVVYHHISASPGRKLNEAANFTLFRERWPQLPEQDRAEKSEAARALRQEGWRYLRKHWHRPWCYNLARTRRALQKIRTPLPLSRELPVFSRVVLAAGNLFGRSKHPRAAEAAKVFLVVHDTVRNPGRSGIQTVVRGLAAAFGRAGSPVGLLVWDAKRRRLRPLPSDHSVGVEAEPLRAFSRRKIPGDAWVLMPEVIYKGRAALLVDDVRRRGGRLAVIFHDAIPVHHPQFVPSDLPAEHDAYMRAFSRADVILPVSQSSAQEWAIFVRHNNLLAPRMKVCPLAGDIAKTPRVREVHLGAADDPIRILCVSSLEPRKNHRTLLEAYRLAREANPDLKLELALAGAPYFGAHDIVEMVHRSMNTYPGQVHWYEQLEYSLLRALYAGCDFTVYPSVLEGFGLPVIESLWFGRPCICADFGAMDETAMAGGCLTTDVRSAARLADAIVTLSQDREIRLTLAQQAIARPLKTWSEYASEILTALAAPPTADNLRG